MGVFKEGKLSKAKGRNLCKLLGYNVHWVLENQGRSWSQLTGGGAIAGQVFCLELLLCILAILNVKDKCCYRNLCI
jgi:hypothetical protein